MTRAAGEAVEERAFVGGREDLEDAAREERVEQEREDGGRHERGAERGEELAARAQHLDEEIERRAPEQSVRRRAWAVMRARPAAKGAATSVASARCVAQRMRASGRLLRA